MADFQHEILEHHHRYTFFYSHGAVVVTVTAHHSVVVNWLKDIMTHSCPIVVGLSFQWNRQVGSDARADVLQLCVADKVLIFQISRAEFLPLKLRNFLLYPSCVFVGDNIYSHLRILTNAGLFMVRRGPMDMRLLVDPELANGSLQTIARSYCTTFSPDILTRNWPQLPIKKIVIGLQILFQSIRWRRRLYVCRPSASLAVACII